MLGILVNAAGAAFGVKTAMLAIFGILGAAFAGVLADGITGARHNDEEGNPTEKDEDHENPDSASHGDLLQDAGMPETIGLVGSSSATDGIHSDDLPDPPPIPVALAGTAADDLLDGTAAADHIWGGEGQDQINSGAGDDSLYGGNDQDLIWAGSGDDAVFGGDGADLLHGDEGDDQIQGGAGNDALYGHAGADAIFGGTGDDSLIGGEGDDSLHGDAGNDWLAGGEGNDSLHGGTGQDTLDGGAGHDTLDGSDDDASDFLNGGDSDDSLWMGAGDHGAGGAGADVFTLQGWLDQHDPANISDYNATEDQLILIYDPATHADPQLSIQPVEGQDAVSILLDGQVIATVNGAVDPADIQLMTA